MATGATKHPAHVHSLACTSCLPEAPPPPARARCTCGHTFHRHQPAKGVFGQDRVVCVGAAGCACTKFVHDAAQPKPRIAGGKGKAARARAAVEPATLQVLHTLPGGDHTERLRTAPWVWRTGVLPSKPNVLAFDLATRGGWAMLSRTGEFSSGTIVAGPGPSITPDWAADVAGLLSRPYGAPTLVVVEDTFVGGGFASGSATACTRLVGAVIAQAAVYRLPVVRVMAATWQSAMLGKRERGPDGRTRSHGKQLSLAKARALFGPQIADDNEADAALLCRWAWGEP